MALSTLPMDELRRLLQGLAKNGKQHLVEVEADLVQTTLLLTEAIEKLGSSFMAIHGAVVAQQNELDLMLASKRLSEIESEKVLKYRQKIAEEVDAAVTGLQFQDMTSQLIARTVKRVVGLRDLLAALEAYGDVMNTDGNHEDVAKLLEAMNKSLSTKSGELAGGLRQAVQQQDMHSGDIELF
ncbi:MAG: chemotaxis protein [Methylophilaceae bacterium]|uniref:chemotaxis protein n=1 Tax=Methylovorus sp. MM2 TaxID=1848038 RepID=UPI0007DF953C|nr:chemotaxis protein [Methylovorus sp. MM2]OAM51293.1 chemotaxis protein [Methylovorus sp. MM2]